MAAVIGRSLAVLISCTTWHFCSGLNRQQSTARHRMLTSRNRSAVLSSATARLVPSMSSENGSSGSRSISTDSVFRCSSSWPCVLQSVMKYRSVDSGMWPQLSAMLSAVSTLSPVSTHTLMPASRSDSSVSRMSSCSASSTAVAPSSSKRDSILRWHASIFVARSTSELLASFSSARNCSYSSLVSWRRATASVRSPHLANSSTWPCVVAISGPDSHSGNT
uniref:Putative secreted protein n=1 Tax=Anopheles darlingi TaxID=43151 RepID=A0A2M4D0J7_ANODA